MVGSVFTTHWLSPVNLREISFTIDVRVPKSYQTTILNNHHDKFRKKLNFRSILSLLNEKGLIPHKEYRELLKIPQTDTNHDRIDRLFAIIPSCGHDDFLVRLIHCLRESVPEAGDAHTELADSLQEALNGYSPAGSVSSPSSKEDETGGSKEEDGHGLDSEIVNPDPSIALIAVEGHEGGRSTLTVEGSNVHTQRGNFKINDVFLILVNNNNFQYIK